VESRLIDSKGGGQKKRAGPYEALYALRVDGEQQEIVGKGRREGVGIKRGGTEGYALSRKKPSKLRGKKSNMTYGVGLIDAGREWEKG